MCVWCDTAICVFCLRLHQTCWWVQRNSSMHKLISNISKRSKWLWLRELRTWVISHECRLIWITSQNHKNVPLPPTSNNQSKSLSNGVSAWYDKTILSSIFRLNTFRQLNCFFLARMVAFTSFMVIGKLCGCTNFIKRCGTFLMLNFNLLNTYSCYNKQPAMWERHFSLKVSNFKKIRLFSLKIDSSEWFGWMSDRKLKSIPLASKR